MNKEQPKWEEEFHQKFPHKLSEVIDDFGSTVKSDLKSFISKTIKAERKEAYKLGVEDERLGRGLSASMLDVTKDE